MKKLVIGALVIALGIVVITRVAHSGTKASTCHRLDKLCGDLADDGQKFDETECEADIDKIERVVGADAVSHAEDCVESANSCVEAAGCITGAATHAVDDFERGFDRGAKP